MDNNDESNFMTPHQRPLTRRTVLRGAGAALALPWLEAMAQVANPAQDQPKHPIRMAALFVPNGVRQDKWTPEGEGRQFKMSPTLEPLADLKDQLLIPTNLWNQASNVGDGHYVKTSGFLTCTTINKSLGIDLNCNGVSVDQVAAQSSLNETPLPSLELAIDPVATGVDTNVGYTQVYGGHISWSGPTSPLAKELDPGLVFDRLFRAAYPSKVQIQRDSRLLDRVLGDAKELHQRLGASDRRRIDEYMQSVRSIERRLQQQQNQSGMPWKPLEPISKDGRPVDERPEKYVDQVRLMLDMIAIAFQTDTTRVATFMFGNAVSGRNFSFLDGVTGGHHDTSHHMGDEAKLDQYQRINRWHVEQYAYLLHKLHDMKEGDATVLSNSMILYGSGIRDGNSHNPHNLPIVVAGSAGGCLDVGQHLVYGKDTPLANLYASMLNAFGRPTENFADSTGLLPGVLV